MYIYIYLSKTCGFPQVASPVAAAARRRAAARRSRPSLPRRRGPWPSTATRRRRWRRAQLRSLGFGENGAFHEKIHRKMWEHFLEKV